MGAYKGSGANGPRLDRPGSPPGRPPEMGETRALIPLRSSMARKTKGAGGRRPGQQRPRPATPVRRPGTTPAATDASIEERLAELERERELLLAAARGTVAEEEALVDEEADAAIPSAAGLDDRAEEDAEPVAATAPAPARTATVALPSASGTRRVGRVARTTAASPAAAAAVAVAAPAVKAPPKGVVRAADALDPEDPSIPLERVPYVSADLRRVGVIAALMIVLIVVADIVVRAVVK